MTDVWLFRQKTLLPDYFPAKFDGFVDIGVQIREMLSERQERQDEAWCAVAEMDEAEVFAFDDRPVAFFILSEGCVSYFVRRPNLWSIVLAVPRIWTSMP